MEILIEAVQIAELFNIKKFRAEFRAEAFSGSTSEVFYALTEKNRYLYVFDYGVVVFANYDPVAKSEFIQFVKNYAASSSIWICPRNTESLWTKNQTRFWSRTILSPFPKSTLPCCES